MKCFSDLSAKQKKKLKRAGISAVLMLLAAVLGKFPAVKGLLFAAAYVVSGAEVLKKAWKGIRKRQPFDENFLMAVASLGAMACGSFAEGAAVILFYQIGELFESIAVGRSRRNITELMDIRPDYANIPLSGGKTEKVSPDVVAVGSEILVFPGEKVPIDGIILEGTGAMDTSALTGESTLTHAAPGDTVLSGSISVSAVLRIRTEKEFSDSTASRILDLVENASSRKARSEKFISKFAAVYTPAVCYSAIALAVLPPVIRLLLGMGADWKVWIYRALTFLVVSCPCALVISIPLTFFAGLGGAGNAGILIKGSNYMEPLSKAGAVVLDKTGTLTRGSFEVTGVYGNRIPEQELITLAAQAEWGSNHPIAVSVKKACSVQPDLSDIRDVREISGKGVIASVGGREIACGNKKLMEQLHVSFEENTRPGTAVYVAADGVFAGCILIGDRVKPESAEAVEDLKALGITDITMLTGDRKSAAEEIAASLQIQNVYAELLPEDKVRIVEKLLDGREKNTALLFVGDGINDAPVLARADLGISMGALGSDAAIEASDIVLMDDDPRKIAKAVRIAKKCMRIVYENIFFAIGIKLLCLLACALGLAGMWLAVFADTGVMILAVLNAIRALKVKTI